MLGEGYAVTLWKRGNPIQTIYTPYDETDKEVAKFIRLTHESMANGELDCDKMTIRKINDLSLFMIANPKDKEV